MISLNKSQPLTISFRVYPCWSAEGAFIHQFIIIKRLHMASSRRITKLLSNLQRLLHLEKILKNSCNILVVLDLSAEFAVIDHNTLVECRIHHWVLKNIYAGLDNLSNRFQFVHMNDEFSMQIKASSGVKHPCFS